MNNVMLLCIYDLFIKISTTMIFIVFDIFKDVPESLLSNANHVGGWWLAVTPVLARVQITSQLKHEPRGVQSCTELRAQASISAAEPQAF
jgi:hypothetical protein